ncbi:alpha/beta hydrolase [Sphingomonas sp. So64.6b]|uniref:alpha/beta fold hydrolase n=1 Tax=Sphingomonas sp. So64.6b TaxID=2997354 RepID=UPI001603B67E|nr:alpha/beta hydrolase [Sphingomonas sp. So64.6b]QNA85527.1 alpha/beta hydrolase [Sphingomonas sp. So64.6b]
MRVFVNGIRLYFDVEGAELVPDGPIMRERPTVVLIHGGPGADHTTFKPFMSDFAQHGQLIYFDHRGMGRSDEGTPDEWMLSQWADDLAGLLDVLEIHMPYLVGASFGGFVAQAFATRYPERLSKLALVSTAPRSDPKLSAQVFARLGGPKAGEIAERFLSGDVDAAAEYMHRCAPHYNVGDMDMNMVSRAIQRPGTLNHFFGPGGEWHSIDFRQGLARIQCPTLVLHGELDPIFPLPLAQEMFAAIPDKFSRLEVVEDAGHGWVDKPEEWRSALKTFLFEC